MCYFSQPPCCFPARAAVNKRAAASSCWKTIYFYPPRGLKVENVIVAFSLRR